MKLFLVFLLTIFNLYASDTEDKLRWEEANKACLKQNKRLPTISELTFLKKMLGEGIYWSNTSVKINKYEFWVLNVDKNKKSFKGVLGKSNEINYICVKPKKIKKQDIKSELVFEEASKYFTKIYTDKVIIFPRGYLSFIEPPYHKIDRNVPPYNFYMFKIKLKEKLTLDEMKLLNNRIIAYDKILLGKVLSISSLDKNRGYEYQILSIPTDLLEPYILPDETKLYSEN